MLSTHRSVGFAMLVMLAGICAVAVLVFDGQPRVSSQSLPDSPLTGVEPELLNDTNGIVLRRPSLTERSDAVVSSDQAVKMALGADPDFKLREAQLAVLQAPVVAADGCLCWAISLEPPPGGVPQAVPPGIVPAEKTDVYYITFVDARTGELLFSATGGRDLIPARETEKDPWAPAQTPSQDPKHPR